MPISKDERPSPSRFLDLNSLSFSEALFVHLIDLLDSQMNIMDQAISKDHDLEDFTSKYNYYKIPLLKKSNGTK